WRMWLIHFVVGHDIHHETIGMFGMGRIGQAMARRAGGFSMRVLYHDAVRAPVALEKSLNLEFVGAQDLLRLSDFVTLHVPLLPETRRMITEPHLRIMNPTPILV